MAYNQLSIQLMLTLAMFVLPNIKVMTDLRDSGGWL